MGIKELFTGLFGDSDDSDKIRVVEGSPKHRVRIVQKHNESGPFSIQKLWSYRGDEAWEEKYINNSEKETRKKYKKYLKFLDKS